MVRAILTDIEGTTTSVSLVFDCLFPYARARMGDFVRENGQDPAVREQLDAVARESGRSLNDDEAVAQLIQWIDQDRKITPLKALQGMIWEAGYLKGDFTGHVYPDAVQRLRQWKAQGLDLNVYSSGSVKAQRLLFGHSDAGDLTPLFSGWFDTQLGPKREADSYRAIAGQIGLPPGDILFLSDIKEELDAAQEAGMRTAWLVRGAIPDPDAVHRQVTGFGQIEVSPDPLAGS
ncbi:MAG: acireductone synthase [Gammaproteobacteria bacterium]|nr:acireductone synthase [Gammaproteobacteria bacterium]MBU1654392.1 acireductone synthase [Gammaproteobacteria bacterium]MBU1960233.1 acireductone synthase [Gammaproteobacteria bacterium]